MRKPWPTHGRLKTVPARDSKDLLEIMRGIRDARGKTYWEYRELADAVMLNTRRVMTLVRKYPWAILAAARTVSGVVAWEHSSPITQKGDAKRVYRVGYQVGVAQMGGRESAYFPASFTLLKPNERVSEKEHYLWSAQQAWARRQKGDVADESAPPPWEHYIKRTH